MAGSIRTTTKQTVLTDEVRESPVDQELLGTRKLVLTILALLVLALLLFRAARAAPIDPSLVGAPSPHAQQARSYVQTARATTELVNAPRVGGA
jgi:hypothetical protein